MDLQLAARKKLMLRLKKEALYFREKINECSLKYKQSTSRDEREQIKHEVAIYHGKLSGLRNKMNNLINKC